MKSVYEPAREVPIVVEADVVIVGGGVGGIMAALGSARAGAKTVLIERYAFLGGTATAGLMTSFNGFRNEHKPDHVQTVRGYAQKLVDRLIEENGACACTAHGNFGPLSVGTCPYAVSFDPEVFKSVTLNMLSEAGVILMLHTTFSDVLCVDGSISAIIIEGKSGRQAVQGKMYVDASGDGDVAVRAGAVAERVAKSGEGMMPLTLMYRVTGIPEPALDERRLWVNGVTTRWGPWFGGFDGAESVDLTEAEIKARGEVSAHVRKLRSEFPDARLVETATAIGVRETRRIKGLYTISEEDILSGRAQFDSIAVSSNPVPGYYGERRFFDHLGFEVPYRSLVPLGIDNLLLSGRCISACQPAFQSARSMAPNMAISQASGTAAALCVQNGCRPADLDVTALQHRLEQEKAVVRVPVEERS
jgi:hypothetical protein